MQKAQLTKSQLPDTPGVYLFTKGKGKAFKILYVGKATSLRDRVRSYFDDDLIATRGPRIVDMVTQAESVTYESTPTVLEALVRESALIRLHKPKANVEGKDDKTFLYAVVTKEDIPRIIAVRAKDIDFKKKTALGQAYTHAHGPFPSGTQLRTALRLIRKIFPFYDTDKPVGVKSKHQRAKIEFNRQIGLYPNDMDRKEYMQSIRHVSLFLSGRVQELRRTLEKERQQAVAQEQFEVAGRITRQLFSLDHVQDVSLIREDREQKTDSGRIEAYDTAHISGTNAIGVMVVVEDGLPNKKEYRTFKIQGGRTQNDDIASLVEILTRRFGHPEWEFPKLIVIDGGKTHKKHAEMALREMGIGIPVVAVVKDEKHRPREVLGSVRARLSDADIVLANSEAHRFSITKHRQARSTTLLGKKRK